MIQQHLYLTDTYLGQQRTLVARSGTSAEGMPWLALAENIFHPRGGGQPADTGTVDGVAGVARRAPAASSGVLRDLAAAAAPPPAGTPATARIDLEARRQHAALHTAGHLAHALLSPRGWTYAACSHVPGQARLDYRIDGALVDRAALAAELNDLLAGAISAGHPVAAAVVDDVRLVSIEGLGAEPCGGTHVRTLASLAWASVRSVKLRGGLLRIGYDARHVAAS